MAKKDLSKISISETWNNDKPTQLPISDADLSEDIARFEHKIIEEPKKEKEGGRPSTIPNDWKKKQYRISPKTTKEFRKYCIDNDKQINIKLNNIIADFLKQNGYEPDFILKEDK